ncbi:MAG: T9SS type A sorting domain-containing protein [Bacteroidota bacterium]
MGASTLSLLDLNGRVLFFLKQTEGIDGLDVSWLDPGCYIIRITGTGEIRTGKFIRK